MCFVFIYFHAFYICFPLLILLIFSIEGGIPFTRNFQLHNVVGYSTSGLTVPDKHIFDHSGGVEKGNQLSNLKIIPAPSNQIDDGSNVDRVSASGNACAITRTLGVSMRIGDEDSTVFCCVTLSHNDAKQNFCFAIYNNKLGGDGRDCILSQAFGLTIRIFLEK